MIVIPFHFCFLVVSFQSPAISSGIPNLLSSVMGDVCGPENNFLNSEVITQVLKIVLIKTSLPLTCEITQTSLLINYAINSEDEIKAKILLWND